MYQKLEINAEMNKLASSTYSSHLTPMYSS